MESKSLKILAFLAFLGSAFVTSGQDNTLEEGLIRGEKLYNGKCAGCHKIDGSGYIKDRLVPPLAKSDYLKSKENSIKAVSFGLTGKITVNGLEYDKSMPKIDWTNQEIADVLNYIRNNWGNNHDIIQPEEVELVRKKEG
ncbi:MAG: cytochrome c [Ekhidna sp.]